MAPSNFKRLAFNWYFNRYTIDNVIKKILIPLLSLILFFLESNNHTVLEK